MKKSLGILGLAAVIAGCSKGVPAESQAQGQSSQPESPQVNQPKDSSPTSGTPPVTSPKSSAPVRPNGAPTSNSSQLSVETRSMPVNPAIAPPPGKPKENPAAAPPRQGEKVAENFRFEVGLKTIEVEGVCKLTEEEAICWKPDGQKNDALATELTNAIKSKSDNYSNTFQFKFTKKNRILVVKTITKPMKPGGQGFTSYSLGLMNEYNGGSEMQEGWANGNSAFSGSNGSSFDQTQTERQVLTGAFSKETKTFPLRYQFTNNSNERKVIPFAKGQFTIEGNSYEIVSINDKPDAGQASNGIYMGGMPPGSKPPKYTYLKIQVVKITNPYTILNLSPADDSGMPYAGLNEKGEPITTAELQRIREGENKKMMEAQRSGKPYNYDSMNRMNGMNHIQSINLDPSFNYGRDPSTGIFISAVNMDMSKIKKLSVGISKRTVFVFDKIKLDAN